MSEFTQLHLVKFLCKSDEFPGRYRRKQKWVFFLLKYTVYDKQHHMPHIISSVCMLQIVDVVLDGCKPEGLAAMALTSCDFIDDLTRVAITRPSPSATEQPSDKQAASSTAAEKPSDDATPSPAQQPSDSGSSNGIAESSNSSATVEDRVCIAGAVSLKVDISAAKAHLSRMYVCARL